MPTYVLQSDDPAATKITAMRRAIEAAQEIEVPGLIWTDDDTYVPLLEEFIKDAGRRFRAGSDLGGKKVAVIPGTTTQTALTKFLKEEFVTLEQVPVKDHIEGRTALENGTVEAYASDSGILIGLALTAADPKRFGLADGLFSYEPYGFMMRRNDPNFRLAVNRALAAVYRSGDIGAIYDRWFGSLGNPSDAVVAMYMLNGLPE